LKTQVDIVFQLLTDRVLIASVESRAEVGVGQILLLGFLVLLIQLAECVKPVEHVANFNLTGRPNSKLLAAEFGLLEYLTQVDEEMSNQLVDRSPCRKMESKRLRIKSKLRRQDGVLQFAFQSGSFTDFE